MNHEFIFSVKKNESGKVAAKDVIRIHKNRVSAELSMLKFIDKDTKQYVLVLPAFDLSGYGETEEKAFEMLKFLLKDVNEQIIKSSKKDRIIFFTTLGWKKVTFKNKEFSKTYVDINGDLQNFNAVDNKIERLTLETIEAD